MPTLFDTGEPDPATSAPSAVAKLRQEGAKPRIRTPNRGQTFLRPVNLEALLPADHQARAVWSYVEKLEVERSELYEEIASLEGGPGRPRIDPRIMIALWLYATLDGVGAARQLDRLCRDHVAYQWICGGVSVNYHTLADFRVGNVGALDRLLTKSVAVLQVAGLVDLKRVAQDGLRVRASAGNASFRRQRTLRAYLDQAKQQVAALRKVLEVDPSAPQRREQIARERAARERQHRVEEALRTLAVLDKTTAAQEKQATSKDDEPPAPSGGAAAPAAPTAAPAPVQPPEPKPKSSEPRASVTDAEARFMKMPDGGKRPAYNVQFAADTKGQAVVGVLVNNSGTDHGQLVPMLDQMQARYGRTPAEMLLDGGFLSFDDIEIAAERQTAAIMPMQKTSRMKKDPYAARDTDSPAIAAWRARMRDAATAPIYKLRAATIECVNALARNRGLQRLLVRGLEKARAVALWFGVAHNARRAIALRVA